MANWTPTPEQRRIYRARWKAKNPERYKYFKQKYKRRGVSEKFAERSREAYNRAIAKGVIAERVSYRKLYENRPNKCNMCGQAMPDPILLDIDHIVPLHKNGPHIESNLQVIHMWCHRVKSQEEATGQEIKITIPLVPEA